MARTLHVRVDRPQGCVGVRIVAGLHVRTVTSLSAGASGRASGGGRAKAETVGGTVIAGPMHIMVGFST